MCWTSDAVYRIRDADAIFRIERKDGQKTPKTRNYSTQSMENLPVIIAEVSVAPSGESFRNTFFFFCACFRRFTVGSIKTRQITLWAVGLITRNHDMRPIRLSDNAVSGSCFSFISQYNCLVTKLLQEHNKRSLERTLHHSAYFEIR